VVIDHATVGVSDLHHGPVLSLRACPARFVEIGTSRDGADEIEFGLEDAADFAISTADGRRADSPGVCRGLT
jgi:hypothetical protein